MHEELREAIAEALDEAGDQSEEFRRRFQRLVENALSGYYPLSDLQDVVELATPVEGGED